MGRIRSAQSMVEIALVLPVLALLIAIALDFGRVYQVAGVLSSAARVATEHAATQGLTTPPPGDICAVARTELGGLYIDGLTTIELHPGSWGTPTPAPGTPLAVTIKTVFRPITPIAQAFLPGGLPLERQTYLWRNYTNTPPVPTGFSAPEPTFDPSTSFLCSF